MAPGVPGAKTRLVLITEHAGRGNFTFPADTNAVMAALAQKMRESSHTLLQTVNDAHVADFQATDKEAQIVEFSLPGALIDGVAGGERGTLKPDEAYLMSVIQRGIARVFQDELKLSCR